MNACPTPPSVAPTDLAEARGCAIADGDATSPIRTLCRIVVDPVPAYSSSCVYQLAG